MAGRGHAVALAAQEENAQEDPLFDYWIDAEGGASTLVVSPRGQSMLVDSANRKPDDRDAKRIHAVAQLAARRVPPATRRPCVEPTAGNGTSVGNARRFGVEWAADLRRMGVQAALLTAT